MTMGWVLAKDEILCMFVVKCMCVCCPPPAPEAAFPVSCCICS